MHFLNFKQGNGDKELEDALGLMVMGESPGQMIFLFSFFCKDSEPARDGVISCASLSLSPPPPVVGKCELQACSPCRKSSVNQNEPAALLILLEGKQG